MQVIHKSTVLIVIIIKNSDKLWKTFREKNRGAPAAAGQNREAK